MIFSHLSLRARMTLSITGLILVMMFITGVVSLAFFEQEYERNMTAQQSDIVRYLAEDVDSALENIQEALVINAKALPATALSNPHAAQAFLETRTGLRRFFKNHLHIYGSDGHLIGTIQHHHHSTVETIADKNYFKETVKHARPFISDPTDHGYSKDQANIILTAPVTDKNGRVIAVMTGGFNLYEKNPLSRYTSVKLGKSGILRIISNNDALANS